MSFDKYDGTPRNYLIEVDEESLAVVATLLSIDNIFLW